MKCRRFLALLPLLGLLCGRAFAQGDDPRITVDEYGAGTIQTPHGTTNINGFVAPDPGPGGLPAVLTYNLPFAGVQGDVLLFDPGNVLGDVVRFNGNGTLIFYSDNVPNADAPADTQSPPGALYTNVKDLTEIGPDGNNGALYTPQDGEPGFTKVGVTYNLISDGHTAVVPEPGSLALVATGGLPLLGLLRRRLAA